MDPALGPIGVYRTETLSHLFELALYISSKDRVRAELTSAKLLQTANVKVSKYVDDDISTIYGEDDDDSCADMPPLVPFNYEPAVPPIELRISEIKGDLPAGGLFEEITKPTTVPVVSVEEEDDELVEEEEEVAEEEEDEVAEEEEEEEEEVADEEEEEGVDVKAKEDEEEEEVLELDLEPVRIKKTIYWKDVNSGDIYEMLPEDEVGDIVGKYVDGKPVFGPGL
jgi:hypothetical protein